MSNQYRPSLCSVHVLISMRWFQHSSLSVGYIQVIASSSHYRAGWDHTMRFFTKRQTCHRAMVEAILSTKEFLAGATAALFLCSCTSCAFYSMLKFLFNIFHLFGIYLAEFDKRCRVTARKPTQKSPRHTFRKPMRCPRHSSHLLVPRAWLSFAGNDARVTKWLILCQVYRINHLRVPNLTPCLPAVNAPALPPSIPTWPDLSVSVPS